VSNILLSQLIADRRVPDGRNSSSGSCCGLRTGSVLSGLLSVYVVPSDWGIAECKASDRLGVPCLKTETNLASETCSF